jgi:hypothetical protein
MERKTGIGPKNAGVSGRVKPICRRFLTLEPLQFPAVLPQFGTRPYLAYGLSE